MDVHVGFETNEEDILPAIILHTLSLLCNPFFRIFHKHRVPWGLYVWN